MASTVAYNESLGQSRQQGPGEQRLVRGKALPLKLKAF